VSKSSAEEGASAEPGWRRFVDVLSKHYPAEYRQADAQLAKHSDDDRTAKAAAIRKIVWPLQRRAMGFASDDDSLQMVALTVDELRAAHLVSADACLDALDGKPWLGVTPPALLDRELGLWATLLERAATSRRELRPALSERDLDRLYDAAFEKLTGADLKVLEDLARADRGAQSAVELEATCRLNIRLLEAVLNEGAATAGGWMRKTAAEWEAADAATDRPGR